MDFQLTFLRFKGSFVIDLLVKQPDSFLRVGGTLYQYLLLFVIKTLKIYFESVMKVVNKIHTGKLYQNIISLCDIKHKVYKCFSSDSY